VDRQAATGRLKVEKDSRPLFARVWADLHLSWDQLGGFGQ